MSSLITLEFTNHMYKFLSSLLHEKTCITGFSAMVPPPPICSSPLAAPTPQGLQPYSFHLSPHHTHIVLTTTVWLQAKQLIAMPDCPPGNLHAFPTSLMEPSI
jgi:hypothetical protein